MEFKCAKMVGLKKLLFLFILFTAYTSVWSQSSKDTTYSENFNPGRLGLVGGGAGLFMEEC